MNNTTNKIGVGLRPTHYPDIETGQKKVDIDWFEAISENYMNSEGRPLKMLLKVRESYPVALHGVGLSIASFDGVKATYLEKLKSLISKVQPEIISDHFCWSNVGSHYSHDLLPFPLTNEALITTCKNIQQVQDTLGRSISLENISYYFKSKQDEMSESEFINEVCQRTGCGILLDLNNVDVNATNHGFDALSFINKINLKHVRQLHLAGPSIDDGFVFDTHSTPVPDSVWQLYRSFLKMRSDVPVIIEWDDNIPSIETLMGEARKARMFSMEIEANI